MPKKNNTLDDNLFSILDEDAGIFESTNLDLDLKVLEEEDDNEEEELIVKDEDDESEDDSIEEEVEEDSQEEEVIEDDDEDEDDDEASFTPLAMSLHEKGVLDFDENQEYDDSEEGLAEMVDYTINKRYDTKLKTLPEDLQLAIKIAEEGGDWTEIVNAVADVDYENLDLEDEYNQTAIIEEYLEAMEYTPEEIKESIESFSESKSLAKQSKIAQKYLVKARKERIIEAEKIERARIENNNRVRDQKITEVKTKILQSDQIAGFKLEKKDKEALIDYIYKPVNKSGKTQLQLDSENDPQLSIKTALFMMKKFDFGTIETKTKTETNKKLKKLLSNYTDTNKTKGKNANRTTKNELYIPD